MRAESLKLRTLPTPRWTMAGVLAASLLALLTGRLAGVGSDGVVLSAGLELPTGIAAIVLGAWIVGLEYGQGTMRRTLTADPRRARVLGTKLAVAMFGTLGLTALAFLPAVALYPAVAQAHGVSSSAADVATAALAVLPANLVGCTTGAAIALLTRSMAGGVTAALVFALVLDSALAAIPSVGDYTLQSSTYALSEAIRDVGDPNVARGLTMIVVWGGVLSGAAVVRFTRTDV